MEEKAFFTAKEREQLFALYKRLLQLSGDTLQKGDCHKLKIHLIKAVAEGNLPRNCFGMNPIIKDMQTAVIVADLLRGKGKVTYTPHADCGDNVIVINAGKAVLTGNKMEQKYYRTHSGWVGGLKETKYRILMQDKPELAMRVAVRGMMPRNIVTKDSLKRLHIYAGEQHDHAAQKPELVK